MDGQEQAVLGASGSGLRFDDVTEPRHGDVDTLGSEGPALPPHRLEVEAAHRQRQVDVQGASVRRPNQGPGVDNPPGESEIAGLVEGLFATPEPQARLLTDTPRAQDVVRIEG